MKTKKLNELSLDELKAKEKNSQIIVIVLGSFMVLTCCILLYVSITSKKPALAAISVACFGSLLPSLAVLKQIKDEIKSRDSK
ncbi:hypothetical protein VUJ46_00295 [Chryseobacterium sp. MYb264]|uniref:hypothetical protein n=1 Tax=unclassified Chryseobacterium TaxID=2593645 RepID=UPI002E0EC980|nr:hypothetical protein VUJ46_00295 [Chryseobacterium sp. MYb264]